MNMVNAKKIAKQRNKIESLRRSLTEYRRACATANLDIDPEHEIEILDEINKMIRQGYEDAGIEHGSSNFGCRKMEVFVTNPPENHEQQELVNEADLYLNRIARRHGNGRNRIRQLAAESRFWLKPTTQDPKEFDVNAAIQEALEISRVN